MCILQLKFEKKSTAILLKKHCCPPSFPTQYNVENQVKLKVLVLNIVWGVGGKVRQVRLYSHLA